jgi:hypothetical protein
MASIMGAWRGCLLRARVPSRSKAMREIIFVVVLSDVVFDSPRVVLLWRFGDEGRWVGSCQEEEAGWLLP